MAACEAVKAEPHVHAISWAAEWPPKHLARTAQILRTTKANDATVVEIRRRGIVKTNPGIQVRLRYGRAIVEKVS
jgi:hypothetical protein